MKPDRLDDLRSKLNPIETAFYNAYESSDHSLWERGMSHIQYEEYVRNGICIHSDKYFDISKDQHGNTIKEVEQLSDNRDEVFMTFHNRFSYPVMHNHTYIEVVYIYSGTCRHFVDDQTFEMKAGDLCFLSPHAMHALSVTSRDTIVLNILISYHLFNRAFLDLLRGGKVMTEFFESIFFKKEFISPYVLYPTGEDKSIRSYIENIYNEVHEQPYAYKQMLLFLVPELLIFLIRKYEMMAVITTATENSFNNIIISVLGYLSINYSRTNLNQTAEFFGYAPNYLGKMLRCYTGKTFTEIIAEYKLENACRLLKETEKSITDISQIIGCFDASHFTRMFRKKYGMSPSQYRCSSLS